MKTFNEIYEMYRNRKEVSTLTFIGVDFEDLYDECNKDIVKYYDFKLWLEYCEDWINIEITRDVANI